MFCLFFFFFSKQKQLPSSSVAQDGGSAIGPSTSYAKTASLATPAHLLRDITNLTQTFTQRSHTLFNQAVHSHPAGAIYSTFTVMVWR